MNNVTNSASAPIAFSFDQSFDVRVIMIDDEPWFVASDVCDALGIDPTAIRKLDDDEKGLHSMQTPGGMQEVSVINESGLYTLILRCRDATKAGTLPHKFRKWVTAEVLPSIRKTGRFQIVAEPAPVLETINRAQMGQLSHLVQIVGLNFHLDASASHAAYAQLRKTFGLKNSIANLPTLYYDQAVQVLTELEKLCFGFKGIVLDMERKFFRQVIRGNNSFDQAAIEAEFEEEIAKLLAGRQRALKLLK